MIAKFLAWRKACKIDKLEERLAVLKAELRGYDSSGYDNPYIRGQIAKAEYRLSKIKEA